MSRIHEALKKAEQDKAGQEARRQATEGPAQTPAGWFAPLAGVTDVPGLNTASSFTFEDLLARCPQGDWKPDTKTMLFSKTKTKNPGTGPRNSGLCVRVCTN